MKYAFVIYDDINHNKARHSRESRNFKATYYFALETTFVQNRIFTAETPRAQRKKFLFGGERLPNKNASVFFGQGS
jgi:hypothetical protein